MISRAGRARPVVPSVNYHVWQACNMRCRFCFATFQGVRRDVLPAGHLNRADSLRIVAALATAGFEKINFAGGEPFLCPWLGDLVSCAKKLGMVTSVVTNGSFFDRDHVGDLLQSLDWLVLSVDSVNPFTLQKIGRVRAHQPMTKRQYLDICDQVRAAGVKLKINTVVTSASHRENLVDFVLRAQPKRWKIMQMLPLDGPDSRRADDLIVSDEKFDAYVQRNRRVRDHGVTIVPEMNEDMLGSYAMVDPAGRFYDNVAGEYRYSEPILELGTRKALAKVYISRERFLARRGRYDFEKWRFPVLSKAWAELEMRIMRAKIKLRPRKTFTAAVQKRAMPSPVSVPSKTVVKAGATTSVPRRSWFNRRTRVLVTSEPAKATV